MNKNSEIMGERRGRSKGLSTEKINLDTKPSNSCQKRLQKKKRKKEIFFRTRREVSSFLTRIVMKEEKVSLSPSFHSWEKGGIDFYGKLKLFNAN